MDGYSKTESSLTPSEELFWRVWNVQCDRIPQAVSVISRFPNAIVEVSYANKCIALGCRFDVSLGGEVVGGECELEEGELRSQIMNLILANHQ
jgi:hypothetical protein